MVSTLRITSVVAVVIAGFLLVLVAGPRSFVPKMLEKFALGSDEEVDRILQAPSVVKLWQEGQKGRNAGRETIPPLVSQAEAFALIINPPKSATPSPTRPTQRVGNRSPVQPPVATSSKFTLVGTSFVAADPQSSFAYVRLPDKTYQWVRPGDTIGHQTIKEIKHGSIVYSDGHGDVETAVEAVPATASILEGGAAAAAPAAAAVETVPARPAGGRITGRPVPRPWTRGDADPRLDAAEEDSASEIMERIRRAKEGGMNRAEEAAEIQRMISEYKENRSSRLSTEEAEKIDDLKRELDESKEAPPRSSRVNINRKLSVPRVPKK